MKDFAAIDFETANRHRSSICSVGIVIVRNGAITEKIHRLVKPAPCFYSFWNTQVHGMTEDDTADAPIFPDVWKDIAPQIQGLTLVAHNSPFDESCLKAAFDQFGLPYPGYQFLCTCRAARKVFGKSLPDHRLPTVAAECGYRLDKHHHALADAEACAAIALKIL